MYRIGEETIAIVTDTSCDLPDEMLAERDIRVVPLRVLTSQGEFRDRTEITADEVYHIMETELPKTSLPLPEDVSVLYRQLQEEGCTRILHLAMSSGLSGTCNMVRVLAEDFDDLRIDVFDSRSLSCGLGLLVLTAADCLDAGKTVEETIEILTRTRGTQLGAFVIRTLEYLRKGGRIGKVSAIVGNLLNLKPVIYVDDAGVYQTLAKARGFNSAVAAMEQEVLQRYRGRAVRAAIVHGQAEENAKAFLEKISSKLNIVDAFISPISPALGIHTGPGLVGIIIQDAL